MSKKSLSLKIPVVILISMFLVSLGLNIHCFLKSYREPLYGDAAFYFRTGQNLAAGLGYTLDGKTPTGGYSIGYPLFVAITIFLLGSNISAIFIIQIILSYVTLILIYLIVGGYFKNIYFKLLPILFYVLNYKIISFNSTILTECFSLFLLIVLLYFVNLFFRDAKIVYIIILSLIFALLTLTRPVFLYLGFILSFLLLAYGLFRKKRYIPGAILFPLLLILILSPVLIRNKRFFGAYKLAFNGGMIFFQGTYIPYNGLWRSWEDETENQPGMPTEIFNKIKDKDINTKDEILRREGIKNIFKNGIKGIPLYLKNISRLLFAYPYDTSLMSLPIQRKFYALLNFIPVVLYFCSLFWSIKDLKTSNILVIFIHITLVYYIIFHAFMAVTPRYGFPALVLSYIIAPFALKQIINIKGRP